MIEFASYRQLINDKENENYRYDINWMLEVESLTKSHLVKSVEIPELSAYSDMLVPSSGDFLNLVLCLPTENLEKQIAQLILGQTGCKAALYMLQVNNDKITNDIKTNVCSTWIFSDFKPVKMKLQNFDRDRAACAVELLLFCSFRDVKIV